MKQEKEKIKDKIKIGDIVKINKWGWKDGEYYVSKRDKFGKFFLRKISDNSYGTFWNKDLFRIKKED